MALALPTRSIFTGVQGALLETATGVARNIGQVTRLVAAADINRGANIDIASATEDAIREAAVATGLQTEIIQDQIANLAHTNYANYLAFKGEVLGKIRAEVMRTYINSYKMYTDIGYDNLSAEKNAKQIALDVKDSQMKIFDLMFPNKNTKIQNVY